MYGRSDDGSGSRAAMPRAGGWRRGSGVGGRGPGEMYGGRSPGLRHTTGCEGTDRESRRTVHYYGS